MEVYLLLEDQGIKGIDLSQPQKGNPGIGGTQFLFVALAHELAKIKGYNISILHYREQKLPPNIKSVILESDVFNIIERKKPDIFIFHPNKNINWYKRIDSINVKCVAWVHNYISYKDASVLADCQNIKAVVFVGKQQYDRYVDHKIINKSIYIYNFVSEVMMYRDKEFKPWVTYVGSLTYPKGFHWISECWKSVIDQIPDAELHVIGSGNLYSRDFKIGFYGIASEEYESQIMMGLTDNDGKIIESVKFHGNMGVEKYDIFKNTAVGIMNPSGKTETFGLGAVEMQMAGIPVISRKKYGLLDTVVDNYSGILINDVEELQEAIINLLIDRDKNKIYGHNAQKFVEEKFDKEKIMNEWENLLNLVHINNDYKHDVIIPTDFLSIDLKWARVFMARIKKISFLKWLPSVGEICESIHELKIEQF